MMQPMVWSVGTLQQGNTMNIVMPSIISRHEIEFCLFVDTGVYVCRVWFDYFDQISSLFSVD